MENATRKTTSLDDVMSKLDTMAKDSRDLIAELQKEHRENKLAADKRIDEIANNLQTINDQNDNTNDRITRLEAAIETNKQDRLKNNIRISGVMSTNELTPKIIASKIFAKLNVNIAAGEYNAYSTKGRAFIIVAFQTFFKKMAVISGMRKKKTLMCEEVFPDCNSNAKIFINDHLSEFNARLLQIAWNAKKEGKLSFVSSNGGKIRIRKKTDDIEAIFITSENQLQQIIDQPSDAVQNSNNIEGYAGSSTPYISDQPTQNQQQQQRLNKPTSNKRINDLNDSISSNEANGTQNRKKQRKVKKTKRSNKPAPQEQQQTRN